MAAPTSTTVYQKPIIYNKDLPYYQLLEDEAQALLWEIKKNLSVAVQQKDLWPGTLFWTNRLNSYLKVYGYQFAKDDHIALVRLLYELVTIPNLESPLVQTWASLLGKLLKKWRLLTREDLQLPWRPLYKLVEQVFYCKYKQLGMKTYSTSACQAVNYLVSQARNYFPVESTREMLEEWRPLLCPFDLAMVDGMNLLADFLPTLLPAEHHQQGFRLWFDEFIHLWLDSHISTAAVEFFIILFVRLAKHNVGYIDWTPYIPQIFTRVLRSFQLPVGTMTLQQNGSQREYLDSSKAASLIVSMLGGGSPAQKHLEQLMVALGSYYHPSNFGKHTKKLLNFLKELSQHLILRLKKERHSKPCWFYATPESVKLTEADVAAFVQCQLPALQMAVFSKVGTIDAATALHNHSLLRPEEVLPGLLSRTYAALQTLTEPHQVTSTLQCVTSISRALLQGGRYPEGRNHLFPLLTLALPGIDPNDFRKTLVSSMLISSLVTLVPLVDCSPSIGHFEMSEQDVELCSSTSQFEDFVLLFLDRCFALVENTGLEQVTALDRMISSVSHDNHESIMGLGIAGSVHSVLAQCSPALFEVSLRKIFHFASSHVFESEVAGRMCADMCASASKVDAFSSLKLFVPRCVNVISTILEDPDQHESEHPDNDLIWNIQLLSQVLHGLGNALLPYSDTIIDCLKSCVHLRCKTAAKHAAKALCNALHCLTMTYPTESRSSAMDFTKPPEEHLYIRDWAAAGDVHNLNINWHESSEEELLMVERVLRGFLQPEMDRLKAFMDGEDMDRDSLHQSLELVWHILIGVSCYLPVWGGKQVDGCPSSVVSLERNNYLFTSRTSKSGTKLAAIVIRYNWDATAKQAFHDVRLPPEQFSRERLAHFVHKLTEFIFEKCEDDTKSMFILVQMLKTLLVNFGVDKQDFNNKWRAYSYSKVALEDKLHGKKQHVRPMLISRVHLQHELRVLDRGMSVLTPLHLTLIKDLFKMSVSTYTEVRIKAQNALVACLDGFLYSGRKLLPDVLPLLKSSGEVSHEQFKGALYVLMLPPMISVYTHDWNLMKQTLPALVQADHSEKPSILALMSRVLSTVLSKYEYFTLQWQLPEVYAGAATGLGSPKAAEELAEGEARINVINQEALRSYGEMVDCLVDLVALGGLQWWYTQVAVQLLIMLVRHDYPLPVKAGKLLVSCLVHDSLTIRKLAIGAMSLLLQQQKRKVKKVPVDVAAKSGVANIDASLPSGERDDNKWIFYHKDDLPQTSEQWEAFTFIDKTHWGYCAWPTTLYTYAPYSEQPQLQRAPEDLSEGERVFFDAFSSPEFVDKLISFLSLEENKGNDHYDVNKYSMFKALFRNFGPTFVPLLKPHLEKLAVDTQESSQRCASEIIAGMVSGSKNWNYEMVQEIREFMEPLLRNVVDSVTPETVGDWGACFTDISANRDPRRFHWILELLMTNPMHDSKGSFLNSSRLYLLQSALAQQEWRMASIHHRLIDYIKPHLSHSFLNVRERIGSIVSQVYLYDSPTAQVKYNPLRKDFIAAVSPLIPTLDQLPTLDKTGKTLKLCKTLLAWLITSYQHSEPELFQLLTMLLPLVTVEDEDEVGLLLKNACMVMSRGELSPQNVTTILAYLKKAIDADLWKVRVSALLVLQVLVFGNLFTFTGLSEEITDLLLRLLEDMQIEVRELAASTLSGLARCGYIGNVDKLKTLFISKSRTKLPKKVQKSSSGVTQDISYEGSLLKRHFGILGLAALVEAFPYSVPEWMPEVLDEIAVHIHDPAPIQASVKKAMSEFRRTHYDSWSEHKQKFTDDQLVVLADLLISPSYYA